MGSLFEEDYLLNVIILGVYANRWLNMDVFQNRNWCSPKSDGCFYLLILTVRGPFHRKDFNWKKYGGAGLISEKTEAL